MRRALVAVAIVTLACGKLFGKHKDAGDDSASVNASTTVGDSAVTCPRPLHGSPGVGYCRARCRNFGNRKAGHHARRVSSPARWAIGKCDKLDVFAEQDHKGAGITEYFDDTGALVGAVDTLTPDCTQYGDVPTCTPKLTWIVLDAGTAPTDDEEDEETPPKR